MATTAFGLSFPNPIGLAAGFDKDARAAALWAAFGFGFAELGTVTPLPQPGNQRPRLFRLPAERALINRLGFNNQGVASCVVRLARARARFRLAVPIGLNVGLNKEGSDPPRDYPALVAAAASVADYVVLNVSSPNTPGLRRLQQADRLAALLDAVGQAPVPLLVKLAPDLDDAEIEAVVRVAAAAHLAGLIIGNTTTARPPALRGRNASEAGGLSGPPLAPRATAVLHVAARCRDQLGAPLSLVACGGIGSGADILDRLREGADLVQLYTSFAYEGAALLPRLHRELLDAMDQAGIRSLPLSRSSPAISPSHVLGQHAAPLRSPSDRRPL